MRTIFKDLKNLDNEPVNFQENDKKAIFALSLLGVFFIAATIVCINNLFIDVSENFLIQGSYFILMLCLTPIFPILSLFCFLESVKILKNLEKRMKNEQNF